MKNFTFIFSTIILLPALARSQKKPDSICTVRISTRGMQKVTKIYLAYQIDGKKIIDSAVSNSAAGTYTVSGKVTRPVPATLVADPDGVGLQGLIAKTKTGAVVDLLQFYLYPGVITLKTDHLLAHGKFNESAINSDNQRLQLLEKPIREQQQTISIRLRSETDKAAAHQLVMQLDSLGRATRPILKKFILENPSSWIALLSLQEYAGSSPDLLVIEPMFGRLSPSVKNTALGKEFSKFLRDRKNLVSGSMAPEFSQSDPAGKPVSLSSFRGKYVLLDFWASWCGPCRQENPGLRKLYLDYKSRNFTILGISLDEADGRQSWLQAIKDDRLDWTQVSDLKHWDNQVGKLYSVRAIPQNYLIDPNGVIIAKGLSHEELKKKLEQILPAQ